MLLLKDVLKHRVVASTTERRDNSDVVCVNTPVCDEEVVELLFQLAEKGILAAEVDTFRTHLPLISACYDVQLRCFRIYSTTPLSTSISCSLSPISPPGITLSTISASLHLCRDASFVDDAAILSYLSRMSSLQKYFVVSSTDTYLNDLLSSHFCPITSIDLFHLTRAPLPRISDQSPSRVFILAGQSNMSGRGQLDSILSSESLSGAIASRSVTGVLSCDPREHWIESM